MTEVKDAVVTRADDEKGTSAAPRQGLARINAGVAAAPVFLTDAAIATFALWTLLYHLNLVLDLRPSVVFAGWLVSLVVAAVIAWKIGWGRGRGPGATVTPVGDREAAEQPTTTSVGWAALLRRYALPVGAAVGAAMFASLGGGRLSWWVAILLGLVAIASAWPSFRPRPGSVGARPGETTPGQAWFVIVTALAAAGFSTLIARVSLDDVFYVGKSVWVAERDEIPFREFLFTEGVLPAGSANPPIPSFEVFIGALARMLGVHAASATWYLVLPVLAVLAIFALWRLVQRWAPRRPLLAFSVALAYIVLVAGYPDALNTYHLPRLTQGKSVFVHALIPLAWVYLTDYLETRSRRAVAMLALLSVAAVGLTTTAVILLPLLAAAAAVAIAATRRLRLAVVCFVAASAYPLLSGVVTRLTTDGVDEVIATYAQWREPRVIYDLSLWLGLLGIIAGLAMWASPLLLRRGAPRLLSAGAALAVTVLLVPGVIGFASDLTGLGAVLWRVPWIVPLPALVGILATVRLPRLTWPNRILAGALPAAMVVAFYTLGVPMWTSDVLRTEPSWRMPEVRKNVTFWITRQDLPDGLVLAPTSVMRAMPQVTTRVRVVMARDLYLTDYGMESQFAKDRLLLGKFADGNEPVAIGEVKAAMDRVGVGAVCVWKVNKAAVEAAPALGLQKFASRKSPGGMVCYRSTVPAATTNGG